MAQTINTNIASLSAQRNLNMSQSSLNQSIQRLSSGLRVNSAKDDAAGLAIAERMQSQIKGSNVAIRNANDAISLAQTAEGALSNIGDNLQRMRELAVQSRNATNSDTDRANLQKEFTQLQQEIGRTLAGTKFNGTSLFTSTASLDFQVGANTTSDDRISVDGIDMVGTSGAASAATASTASLDVVMSTVTGGWDGTNGIAIGGAAGTGTTLANSTQIDDAINVIDAALTKVNDQRAEFGAVQNRFEAVISNLQVNAENVSAARGRIMDADYAAETANLTRAQILQQAGTAMLAQANATPQNVLKLLG
ncbi:flagellin domain-containing protein [soil metagenome]